MRRIYLLAAPLLLLLPASGRADQAADAAQCQKAAGGFLVGTVAAGPTFKPGSERKQGVWLSHTHVTLQADGASYDVAIDNVFANGYQKNARGIPAPLDSLRAGDRLEVCGQPFPGGIHFVHTNCGDPPSPGDPDGWVRRLDAAGIAGDNLEAGRQFCYLFKKQGN